MPAWLKTLGTHLVAIIATVVATASWSASHGIDLYAIYGQINTIIAEIAKLIATVTPILTMIYGIYRSQPQNRIAEIAADPKAVEAAKTIAPTPQITALADALKK